ncbi:MAG: sigma-70 family RNA polymerase sigma factor [Planctomycetes bacterium]|nr:sigma-70 family RNA polymerase sigma factor [Planctomycetota bacterium]
MIRLRGLLARHWAPCYRVALSATRDSAGVEDAAQEAFAALTKAVREDQPVWGLGGGKPG